MNRSLASHRNLCAAPGRRGLGTLLLGAVLALPALSAPALDPRWKLVWADEFDQPGRPDPSKWNYEKGRIRNHELQYYTVDRAENARVEDGCLVIEGRHEDFSGATYTAASLITRGKAAWTYGRVEVKAKLPAARGTWPAIWMLGNDKGKVGWPRCGEIDSMEHVGHEPGAIHGTVHTGKYNHVQHTAKGGTLAVPDATAAFHVYAIEWDAEKIAFFVDDKNYFTFKRDPGAGDDAWPFDHDCFLLLNLAIGGAWGGQKGVDAAAFPQQLRIDYVRVYQRKTDTAGAVNP